MNNCFSNATVLWSEREILRRESLVREIPVLLLDTWRGLNPAVQMERTETPILTPAEQLSGHIEAKFNLIDAGRRGYLRPETTAGTFEAMRLRFEERYAGRIHSLVRLTLAQNPFFDGLEARLPEYRAVRTPTLILAGEQDRAIPLWAQARLADVFPHSRFELLPEAGHVVYLERRDLFFPRLARFLASRDPQA